MSDLSEKNINQFFDNIIKILIDEPEFAEFVFKQKALYAQKAISEPLTLRKEMHDLFNTSNNNVDIEIIAKKMMNAFPKGTPTVFNVYSPAQECDEFLDTASKSIDKHLFVDILNNALEFDHIVIRAGLDEAIKINDESSFEKRVNIVINKLLEMIELWYKKLLAGLLQIAYIQKSKKQNVPNELGRIIIAAKGIEDFPYSTILDNLSIIRNSLAHKSYMINIHSESILFQNNKKDNEILTFGPLNWEGIIRLSNNLNYHCSALRVAFIKHRRLNSM